MTKPEPPCLPTTVGHASWGDNQYRGHAVLGTLAGRDGYWSAVSLAIGGPRLGPQDAGALDDVTICALAADPRIWPLKAARVGSAFGSLTSGLCTGQLAVDRARVGPATVGGAAALLHELRTFVDTGSGSIEDFVDRRIGEGRRLPGFGVPFRPEDERLEALRRCMDRRGRLGRTYWASMESANRHGVTAHGLPANVALGIAAVALDIGFGVEQVGALPPAFLLPGFLANAYEGAQQRPTVLQRLPDEVIEYVGVPPRTSPRARDALDAIERDE